MYDAKVIHDGWEDHGDQAHCQGLAEGTDSECRVDRTIRLLRHCPNNELNGQNQPDNGEVDVEEIQLATLSARPSSNIWRPFLPVIWENSTVERAILCGRGYTVDSSIRTPRYLPGKPSQWRTLGLYQQMSPAESSTHNIPRLCERSVRYHSVQYKISGCPKVSITKKVQKKAMDFFRVCNEYGSGGGSEGRGPFPSSIGAVLEWRIRESGRGSNQETTRETGGSFVEFTISRSRACWTCCNLFCQAERADMLEDEEVAAQAKTEFLFLSRNRQRRRARVLPLSYYLCVRTGTPTYIVCDVIRVGRKK